MLNVYQSSVTAGSSTFEESAHRVHIQRAKSEERNERRIPDACGSY